MTWWMWLVLIVLILGAIGSNKEKRQKVAAENEILKRRKEAEDYILNSGDKEAIKMLMLARANPANYSQTLAGGMNTGNSTLKTALGVMTGVVVGNMVANAATAMAISSALDSMKGELNGLAASSISDAADGIGSIGDLFG